MKFNKSEVTNYVHGSLEVLSDPNELSLIVSNIEEELKNFGSIFEKKCDNEFIATRDQELAYLRRIVDASCKGIAEVRNTTQIQVGLRPSESSFNINSLRADLTFDCKIQSAGNFYVVTSHRPLTTQEEVFNKLSFVSCRASIIPPQINPEIVIDSATQKDNAYCWVLNDIEQAQRVVSLFNQVRKQYPDQKISSIYQYAFRPIIDKSVLAELKYNNYDKLRI